MRLSLGTASCVFQPRHSSADGTSTAWQAASILASWGVDQTSPGMACLQLEERREPQMGLPKLDQRPRLAASSLASSNPEEGCPPLWNAKKTSACEALESFQLSLGQVTCLQCCWAGCHCQSQTLWLFLDVWL